MTDEERDRCAKHMAEQASMGASEGIRNGVLLLLVVAALALMYIGAV